MKCGIAAGSGVKCVPEKLKFFKKLKAAKCWMVKKGQTKSNSVRSFVENLCNFATLCVLRFVHPKFIKVENAVIYMRAFTTTGIYKYERG